MSYENIAYMLWVQSTPSQQYDYNYNYIYSYIFWFHSGCAICSARFSCYSYFQMLFIACAVLTVSHYISIGAMHSIWALAKAHMGTPFKRWPYTFDGYFNSFRLCVMCVCVCSVFSVHVVLFCFFPLSICCFLSDSSLSSLSFTFNQYYVEYSTISVKWTLCQSAWQVYKYLSSK